MRWRIVQAILIPYILYFLPLLPWTKTSLSPLISSLRAFFWGNHKKSIPFASWEVISSPTSAGGLGCIDLLHHAQARRMSLIHKMFVKTQTWSVILWEMINAGTVHYFGQWNLAPWDKLFSHAPCKVKGLIASLLVNSWKECCKHLNWADRFRYIGNSLDIDENIYWSFYFRDYPARLLAKTSHYFHKQGINKLSDILDEQGGFIPFSLAQHKFKLKQDSQRHWFLLCTYVDEINLPLNMLPEDRFRDWHLPSCQGHWWQAPTKFFDNSLLPEGKVWERGNKV